MVRSALLTLGLVASFVLAAAPVMAGDETVPDVVGLNVEKARSLMQEAGFQVTVKRATGRPLDVVFSQDPSGLCVRDTSIPITLHVGGPTPKVGTDMPTNEPTPPTGDGMGAPPAGDPGMPPADDNASRGATDPAPSNPAPRDPAPTATNNWPTAPSGAGYSWKGTPVQEEKMASTSGPTLPGVLGQQTSSARRSLGRWRVREEQTASMPELVGQVLNMWPYAGTNLAEGEEVTIVVGVARAPSNRHRGVPQVQDREWRQAAAAVERAGFTPHFTAVSSPESKRGKIVMQTPLPGSLLELGGRMHMRIGAGEGSYTPGKSTPMREPVKQPDTPRVADTTGSQNSGSQPADAPPAGAGTSPIDGPPTGAGNSPIDTPPADEPRVPAKPDTPPVAPPADQPTVDTPTREPTSTRSFSAPALRTPPEGESYPYKYGANFQWTAVTGAKSYELEIQEELPSGAWQSLKTHTVRGTKFRPDRIERGRYRWRVRAIDGASKGRWSKFWRLYMY